MQQLVEENYLRWDSLGEFLALAVSLEDEGLKTGNAKAKIVATALDAATGKLSEESKAPGGQDKAGPRHLAFHPKGKFAFTSDDFATTDVLSQTTLSTGDPTGTVNNPAHS